MNGTICSAFSPNVACIFLCNLRNEVPMDTCTLVDFAAYHVKKIGQEGGLLDPKESINAKKISMIS